MLYAYRYCKLTLVAVSVLFLFGIVHFTSVAENTLSLPVSLCERLDALIYFH